MPLPASINDWPEAARAAYHALRQRCTDLRLYVDLSDRDAARINELVRGCVRTDPGDGSMFAKAERLLIDRFLTQTIH